MAALGLIDNLPGADLLEFLVHGAVTSGIKTSAISVDPRDLEESAMIDGCNHFTALAASCCRSRPRIAATCHFRFRRILERGFCSRYPVTTETSMRTLSAGLLYIVGQYEVHGGRYRPASS